jgi:hypothetical protein
MAELNLSTKSLNGLRIALEMQTMVDRYAWRKYKINEGLNILCVAQVPEVNDLLVVVVPISV